MGVATKPPGPMIASLIEWRAGRIEDPIERLRFLRSAAGRASRPVIDASAWRHVRLRGIAPVLLWAFVFLPAPGPSNTRKEMAVPTDAGVPGGDRAAAVWLVENNAAFEIYSNGLRVEKEHMTTNRLRGTYPIFRRTPPDLPGPREEPFSSGQDPAGIVFHSTESHMAPFEPAETRTLKRLGKFLIDYVRQKRAYHYLIDRFGRVYRVVQESDAANHAGRSLWADSKGTYVYLNDSFLGVALEAQTDRATVSAAQTHALRVLTEMLRAKYRIPAGNCITHAQVSVNMTDYLIGYHTDWAIGFPFAEAGLPDNYRLPLASISEFGFDYDNSFLNAAGDRRWSGLTASLSQVREQALASGVPLAQHRRLLQQRFESILNSAAIRDRGEEQ